MTISRYINSIIIVIIINSINPIPNSNPNTIHDNIAHIRVGIHEVQKRSKSTQKTV